jgi:hypothetical protein
MICGMCSSPISVTRRLCGPCLNRAHLAGCPRQCSCGFSKLFWADVDAQVKAMKLEAELSVAGPKFTAVNVLLPGCDARTDDGRPHGTQPCSRERRMRKAKFGQPMPDSGKVNRVRSGSRVVRTEAVEGSGGRDRTIAECGAF